LSLRRPVRPHQRLRRIERRISRLLRQGPSGAPVDQDLVRAYAARAEVLVDLGEDDEAFAQLDQLIALLGGPEGEVEPSMDAEPDPEVAPLDLAPDVARAALITNLGRRTRLAMRHEERHDEALADAERALALLEEATAGGALSPDLARLEVELLVHRGRLLNLAGDGEAAREPLERAVARAGALPEAAARRLFVVRARRELAVTLAQAGPDEGLAELDRAEAVLAEPAAPGEELPQAELQMLVSTRAEVLANAGRFDEALILLEGRPRDEDWALLQRAATLEMAGRVQDASDVGARVIERLQERVDPRDPQACHELADALLAQAQRMDSDDDRGALATRAIVLLEEFMRLPARSLRLLCQLLEVQASCLEPPDAHEVLRRRAHILEDLARDLGAEVDRVELVRTYLQDGDVLMRMVQPHVARRAYAWAVDDLLLLDDPEHPAVLGLLPLALNAHAHGLAACDLWLAARRRADEAVAAAMRHPTAPSLARLGELFLFRTIAHVNAGDPEGAVGLLREDITRLLEVALREEKQSDAGRALIELVMNACVLAGEVLVDHLDAVDEAITCYDQAIGLCDLLPDNPQVRGSILGAKAAMLTERGRPQESLPLLRRCVELFSSNGSSLEAVEPAGDGPGEDDEHEHEHEHEGEGELAQALINLAASLTGVGSPREALGEIQRADGLLAHGEDDDEEEPAGEDGEEQDEDGDGVAAQRATLRSQLFRQRGEALLEVGHPLLAADEFTRSVDLCRELIDRGGEARYEAQQHLPIALLQRARSWLAAGDHEDEAKVDLREARRLFRALFEDEARPMHGRRLEEIRSLQRRARDRD
jgi:tetratricopeptide (TPR) repeat protein